MNFKTLVRLKTGNAITNQIMRIYADGWIDNLAYFEEVVSDEFESFTKKWLASSWGASGSSEPAPTQIRRPFDRGLLVTRGRVERSV